MRHADAPRVLFDFTDPAATNPWAPIDDRVMGGASHSHLRHDPAGHAVFEGTVSLERNGGFASVRSAPGNLGRPGAWSCLLAVRGDHHCLLMVDRWLHGDRVRLAIVMETDDDRITHMVWFDEDQLVDAQVELDRRWLKSIGQAGHWYAPHLRDLYDPRPDGMFAYLTADFVYVDHRPLMFPDGDAEQLRVNVYSMEQQMMFVVPRIHALSEAGAVVERLELAAGEVAQTHVVFVGRFAANLVQRLEAFDITQLDAALARYEELTGNSPLAG